MNRVDQQALLDSGMDSSRFKVSLFGVRWYDTALDCFCRFRWRAIQSNPKRCRTTALQRIGVFLWLAILVSTVIAQQPSDSNRQFLDFVRAQGEARHQQDRPPESLDRWRQQRAELQKNLISAWGGFPDQPCPLNPKKLGEISGDGYRVEKIIFQTRPDVWMTANAYVPNKDGKLPAVLCVHGHWRGAKQDPVVQSRCIGLVKHGFFVLVVDAFGAGERAVGKALGEYHGDMTGATLFPVGLALSGLQVYENMRAVDYLRARPEVDGERIGITGASGGGNQTMYAGGRVTPGGRSC